MLFSTLANYSKLTQNVIDTQPREPMVPSNGANLIDAVIGQNKENVARLSQPRSYPRTLMLWPIIKHIPCTS